MSSRREPLTIVGFRFQGSGFRVYGNQVSGSWGFGFGVSVSGFIRTCVVGLSTGNEASDAGLYAFCTRVQDLGFRD